MAFVHVDAGISQGYQRLRQLRDIEYMTCAVTDGGANVFLEHLVIGKKLTSKALFDQFVQTLPEDCCRVVFYGWRGWTEGEGEFLTIVLIVWCPATAQSTEQSQYLNAHSVLRQTLAGIGKETIATHKDDLDFDEVRALCEARYTTSA